MIVRTNSLVNVSRLKKMETDKALAKVTALLNPRKRSYPEKCGDLCVFIKRHPEQVWQQGITSCTTLANSRSGPMGQTNHRRKPDSTSSSREDPVVLACLETDYTRPLGLVTS